ncbi:aspartate kinase [Carboxydocella thermautotrophica]|nr:aspartate kinase [Carboxydocella thermautotrophica]
MVKIIVQKFGGTSVADGEGRARAIERILAAKAEGYQPVVVVSAMGRKGAPYATDTLISLVKEINPEVNPRELDLLISCGEIISTVVMAHTLNSMGHPAIALTGGQAGIKTDANFGNAQILEVDPMPILRQVMDDKIVVVAGFQGIAPDGSITTLGRGGSDTTATALGAALQAEVVEIYTDVDGVMTVDPRVEPEAKILEEISYREVCEMAYQGAKVIHPRAVEVAMSRQVPIRIKNTFSDAKGTLISQSAAERVITGIAHLTGLSQVRVLSSRDGQQNWQLVRVKLFRVLAEKGISVDVISVLPDGVYFTVSQADGFKACQYLHEAGFACELVENCAKVSVIGAGMQGVPGVMAEIMETLYSAGIDILQTSDSDITISFLVPESQLKEAVHVLHRKLGW